MLVVDLPEDLVRCLLQMDRQHYVSMHVPLPSLKIHHTHSHVRMYESQHSSIVPTKWFRTIVNKKEPNFETDFGTFSRTVPD